MISFFKKSRNNLKNFCLFDFVKWNMLHRFQPKYRRRPVIVVSMASQSLIHPKIFTLCATCCKRHGDNIIRARLMGEPREWLLKRRAYLSRSASAMQRVMYFKSVPFEGGVKSRCKIWSNKTRRELDLAGSFSAPRCDATLRVGWVVPCRKLRRKKIKNKKKEKGYARPRRSCVNAHESPLQTYRPSDFLHDFLHGTYVRWHFKTISFSQFLDSLILLLN